MRFYKLIFALVLLTALGCKKENKQLNNPSLSDFPLASGDVWNYQLFDSVNNTTQNATFKITGSYALNGPSIYYTTQTIIAGTVVDSGLIVHSGDTVKYQPNGQGLFSNLTLLFPLTLTSHWQTSYYNDSVFVIAANFNYTVLNNNYDSVYNVGRIVSLPDLYIHQNLYIAPHVGIVQQSLENDGWFLSRKTLKLVSYTLH